MILGGVFNVHATKKLLDRLKLRAGPPLPAAETMLGGWYANLVSWRSPMVLFVNERTLLSVLVPLSPSKTLIPRFREQFVLVLRSLGIDEGFLAAETGAMGDAVWTKTVDRSVLGTLNEFIFLADAWRSGGGWSDPLDVSLHLAEVPCRASSRAAVFPDHAIREAAGRWKSGELVLPAPVPTPADAPAEPAAAVTPITVRNRVRAEDLTEEQVTEALARIAQRDVETAREAGHIYDTLTWGEGPRQITQAAVQDWLWYRLPTKYLTDEVGYMSRLAGCAAELFDELGLERSAAICRSAQTAAVHAAFDRSNSAGYGAMRKAQQASGIEPPDTVTFRWGGVMGMEEALTQSMLRSRLEEAIDTGELTVGAKGWKAQQQQFTERVLDEDHPNQVGQSWRTTVVTERVGSWIEEVARRSPEAHRLRSTVANRLLHPIVPPPDLAELMNPLVWFLGVFGDSQPLTQAGNLSPAFVADTYRNQPWTEEFTFRGVPRTEAEAFTLGRVRECLTRAGALRKEGNRLRRTKAGAAMLGDRHLVWTAVLGHLGDSDWSQFLAETYGLVLLDRGEWVPDAELGATVATLAADLGWRTDGTQLPSERDVTASFSDARGVLELLGLLTHIGDYGERRYRLTPAGELAVLHLLRVSAAGPRNRP